MKAASALAGLGTYARCKAGALLSTVAAASLLLAAPAVGQTREEMAKSLAELSKTVQSTAEFIKLYQLHSNVLRLARLQPQSSPPVDEVQLGEEIEFGNPTAPGIAVVFLDYECAHCLGSGDFIASLAKPGARDLRVVVRFPTGTLLKDSANVLLHCLYDRSPSTFPAAFGHLHRDQPKSQEDLRKFALMAGLASEAYEQCLGGTKAMERIFNTYRYNIALYESCPSIGCRTAQDTNGETVSTIGVPLAIFGTNPANGGSFKITGYKSGADWWR